MSGDPILQSAREILKRTPQLGKCRTLGAPVTSTETGTRLISAADLAQLHESDAPSREVMQRVIWALDLIAVGRPDQVLYTMDPEVQRIAGKLRERFSRTYKKSAYADARATKNN